MKNIELKDAITQSTISCKPSLSYELKRVDDEPSCEKPIERTHRRDENLKNHTNNPFSSKSKENHDIKTNHLKNPDKNSSHRNHSRHQDDHNSLRSKQSNHRPKENERREPVDVEQRSKRRRSPSASKDHKRARCSRSKSRSKRDRERNVHGRNSPQKVSRNSVGILHGFQLDVKNHIQFSFSAVNVIVVR